LRLVECAGGDPYDCYPSIVFGLVGVAVAWTLLYLVVIPFHAVVLWRVGGINLWSVIWRCRAAIGAGAAMAAAVVVVKAELAATLPPVLLLIVLVAVGVVAYAAALAASGRREIREIVALAGSAIGRRPIAAS
jgi:Polysaccharide biosynthesis C-terminal domain